MLVFISLLFVVILLLFKCCIKDSDYVLVPGGPQGKHLKSRHIGRHDSHLPQLLCPGLFNPFFHAAYAGIDLLSNSLLKE